LYAGAALLLGMAMLMQPVGAESRGPVYKDAERFSEPSYISQYGDLPPNPGEGRSPATRVVGDSDYMGSVYGLGKPHPSGVGPRPDWGRSSQ
jgi:hypothetical protein